jgi:hypothetical protein
MNNDLTMTENSALLENWKHKDISIRGLIDLDFPFPIVKYEEFGGPSFNYTDFNISGFKAITYGKNYLI